MSRVLNPPADCIEPWLLDPEVWDSPCHLTEADLFAHAGPGWRRGDVALDDPEDDR